MKKRLYFFPLGAFVLQEILSRGGVISFYLAQVLSICSSLRNRVRDWDDTLLIIDMYRRNKLKFGNDHGKDIDHLHLLMIREKMTPANVTKLPDGLV